jgi:uncharacterized protein (DUF2236 family)
MSSPRTLAAWSSGYRHGSRWTSTTANAAASSPDVDLRDLIDGAALLASTANAVMQLARPEVGYGVLEPDEGRGAYPFVPVRRAAAADCPADPARNWLIRPFETPSSTAA